MKDHLNSDKHKGFFLLVLFPEQCGPGCFGCRMVTEMLYMCLSFKQMIEISLFLKKKRCNNSF